MTEAEVRTLLALCEAADDQDTGSLDAFREAASVGVVADLCRAFLARGEVVEVARRHTCDVFRCEGDEGTVYCEMCEALAA